MYNVMFSYQIPTSAVKELTTVLRIVRTLLDRTHVVVGVVIVSTAMDTLAKVDLLSAHC